MQHTTSQTNLNAEGEDGEGQKRIEKAKTQEDNNLTTGNQQIAPTSL